MLAESACDLLEEWGTLAYKKTSMEEALSFIRGVIEDDTSR
jgi:hypothetical protein